MVQSSSTINGTRIQINKVTIHQSNRHSAEKTDSFTLPDLSSILMQAVSFKSHHVRPSKLPSVWNGIWTLSGPKEVPPHSLTDFAVLSVSMLPQSRQSRCMQAQWELTMKLHQVKMSHCLWSKLDPDKQSSLLQVRLIWELQSSMSHKAARKSLKMVLQSPKASSKRSSLELLQMQVLSFGLNGSSLGAGQWHKSQPSIPQLPYSTNSCPQVSSGSGTSWPKKSTIWLKRRDIMWRRKRLLQLSVLASQVSSNRSSILMLVYLVKSVTTHLKVGCDQADWQAFNYLNAKH